MGIDDDSQRGAASRTAHWLAQQAARVLERPPVDADLDASPGALGFDSLSAAQLAGDIEAELGVRVTLSEVLDSPSWRDLAARLDAVAAEASTPGAAAAGTMTARTAAGHAATVGAAGRDSWPGERAPSSSAQQRIWFAHQLSVDPAVFNLAVAFRLRGPVAVDSLERAIQHVAARHESLRSTFEMAETGLVVHLGGSPPRLEVLTSEAASPQVLTEALQGIARRPFDLRAGPLLRAVLLELAEDDRVLVLAAHHIVCDGWSLPLFLREVERFYPTPAAGEARLDAPPFRVAEYAHFQQRQGRPERIAGGLEFWRAELDGAPERTALWRSSREERRRDRGGRLAAFALDAGTVNGLRDLRRDTGCTGFMIVLAALCVLLHRYSAECDQVIGVPVRDQSCPGTASAIGLFQNLLPIRVRLVPETSLRALLQDVRAACLRAYDHQDVAFELLVEHLRPARQPGASPFFQVMLSYLDQPPPSLALPGVAAEEMQLAVDQSEYELSVFVQARGGEIAGRLVLGGGGEVEPRPLAAHFARVLRAFAECPDVRVGECPLDELGGRAAAVIHPDPVLASVRAAEPVVALVEAQVRMTPDLPAVAGADGALTYRQLDLFANRLAGNLRRRGAGAGEVVGILTERTAGMVAAVLAVLKTGAAYLPLDPAQPLERLRFMAADSGARLLVADQAAWARRPLPGMEVVPVDGGGEPEPVDARDLPPPPRPAGPEQLVYVIYTSGSTGAPKGVMVRHGSLMNLLASLHRQPGVRSGEKIAAVTTLAFDIAVVDLLVPLTAGAAVHLCDADTAADGRLLAEFLRRSGATLMQATPSTWRMLLDAGWRPHAGLRMISTGEALTEDLARHLLAGGGELWNLYGPTETTVWSTLCRVAPEGRRGGGGIVSIGRPIANSRCLVLGELLEPAPVGGIGELCVAGECLARGYHGRPALTAERFVPDPFAPRPGERLYRTGDLARRRRDGELEIIGRTDRQIKLCGYRIEAGEVESAISDHPAIRQCVVALKPRRQSAEPALVAYLALRAGYGPAPVADLRSHARRRLPEFMIPSAWVWLEDIPLTPNRKVAYEALPPPAWSDEGGPEDLALPAGPVEAAVSEIWRELLDIERVGVESDFFAMGGTSLLAGRMLARVSAATGVELPVRTLFAKPTVRALAAEISGRGLAARQGPIPSASRIAVDDLLRRIDGLTEAEVDAYLLLLDDGKASSGR